MILLRPWVVALVFALFALCDAGGAKAERRVALVIGNDSYEHIGLLHKAAADASGYAALLKSKGFEVILKTDQTRSEMDDSIAAFVDMISPGDTAVFVYSGHGWSDGVQNYIVGTDVSAGGSKELLARRSIPLKNGFDGVIDSMDQRGATLKVAIIDACRNNPFQPPAGQKGIGLSRGLAPVTPPSGTFVVYSAGAGQSALDRLSDTDPDPNGLFTRVFLPLLAKDMPLLEAVKAAQQSVSAMARRISVDQWPAYYDEVIGSACLSSICTLAVNGKVAPLRSQSPDEIAWPVVALTTDAKQVENFITRFPDSVLRSKAEDRLAFLRMSSEPALQSDRESQDEQAWSKVTTSNFAADFREFIAIFPQSVLRHQAEARLMMLDDTLWEQTDAGDETALNHYLSVFPEGNHRGVALALLTDMAKSAQLLPSNNNADFTSKDKVAWSKVVDSQFSADFREFIAAFPQSALRWQAKEQLKILDEALWQQTSSSDETALNHYLAVFPDGKHRNGAEEFLKQIEEK